MNKYNNACSSSGMHTAHCTANGQCTDRAQTDTFCACPKTCFPVNTAYAMAYVPFQQNAEVYACDKALSRGTIFPCLDLPFLKGCCK